MKNKFLLFAMFLTFAVTILMSFQETVKTIRATWVSTCGVKHITTFTGNWTESEMAYYIGQVNASECGNYPKSVTFN